ncbi:MAG: hypothetical protein EPN97_12765 [Alphaproteobacteria bacterium]|nr:MAG: hypothetical protein EPN97_12765 [Alphaproteobacteria bacterium]
MLSRLKNMAGRLPPLLCIAAMLMLCAAPTAAAEDAPTAQPVAPAAPVTLRVGEHTEYTRLVFDFTRLTAYTAERSGQSITLLFETSSAIALPADKFHLITSMTASRPDSDSVALVINMVEGASARDYRLKNKIVVDVYAQAKKTAHPKVAEATPQPAPPAPAVKPPEPKKEDKPVTATGPIPLTLPSVPPPAPAAASAPPPAAAAASTPASPPAPAQPPATAAAVPAPAVIKLAEPAGPPIPPAPAVPAAIAAAAAIPSIIMDKAPVAPVEAAVLPEEPTKISISTVEPARLAVFSRFDVLWIVLDSEAAGAVLPGASGPEAGLLGTPQVVGFKGGTAYRYTLPPKRYLSIEKKSLTWNVYISTSQRQTPANTLVHVDYDESKKIAKLMTELEDASNPLEIQDPASGDTLYVLATTGQGARIDQAQRFPDVEILPAAIGMAIRPLADDIRVNRIENFVMITAPDGIQATPGAIRCYDCDKDDGEATRLFNFPAWRMGGIPKLYRNRRLLEDKIASAAKPEERQELLMKLALLYFANNFGQETLGVLSLIEQENEDMAKNPNFIALRGAASAMAGHYQDALKDLSHPLLQKHPEVNLWIGYAAAGSEQWRMANSSFPSSNRLLLQYPDNISVPFTIYMAESALRLGRTDSANALLSSLDSMSADLDRHYVAAIQYLKGEAARQAGKNEEAIRLWQPVAFGLDRLYHTKASLALANLRLQDKKITLKQAIDVVDSLRFAWRGDGLEVQILQNLGDLKVRNRQYLSGLEDMNTAAALADDMLDDSQPIRDEMRQVFSEVFVGGKAKDMPPLEAVSLYTEFKPLMPEGADGSTATLNFADSLISIDLLDKAEKLLEEQIKSSYLSAEKTFSVGAKLAAIYLLDNAPDKALTALQNTAGNAGSDALKTERELLKARALSQLNRTDDAIAVLSEIGSKEAKHLKADVLWRARKWGEAAQAIEDLLPPPEKGLSDDDAQMVVNAAVAWKLEKKADRLQQLKVRYGASMAAITTSKIGDTFGTITRSTGGSSLADRDTLLKITGEVDMFKGFLENYKAGKGS